MPNLSTDRPGPVLQIEAAENEMDLEKPPAQDVLPENSPESGAGK